MPFSTALPVTVTPQDPSAQELFRTAAARIGQHIAERRTRRSAAADRLTGRAAAKQPGALAKLYPTREMQARISPSRT